MQAAEESKIVSGEIVAKRCLAGAATTRPKDLGGTTAQGASAIGVSPKSARTMRTARPDRVDVTE